MSQIIWQDGLKTIYYYVIPYQSGKVPGNMPFWLIERQITEFVAAISNDLLQKANTFPKEKDWTQFFWYSFHFPLLKRT